MKYKKLKQIIFKRVIPSICIFCIISSVFVISAFADTDYTATYNTLNQFMLPSSNNVHSDYPLQYASGTNGGEWTTPHLTVNNLPSSYKTYHSKTRFVPFALQNMSIDTSSSSPYYTLHLPITFYKSESCYNDRCVDTPYCGVTNVKMYLYRENSSRLEFSVMTYDFSATKSYLFYITRSIFEFNNVTYIELEFDFTINTLTLGDSIFGGLYGLSNNHYLNVIRFEKGVLNENEVIYSQDFGDNINNYFEFENDLLGSVDGNSINNFFSDLSILDNFGNGIAAVRSIFNQYINYNGVRWTWLYNLLVISLFIGLVSFVLGFSVHFGGSISRQIRSNRVERHNRVVSNRIGFK